MRGTTFCAWSLISLISTMTTTAVAKIGQERTDGFGRFERRSGTFTSARSNNGFRLETDRLPAAVGWLRHSNSDNR